MNKEEVVLVSTLYKGVHYDYMKKYKSDIIKNHKSFAEFNDMDYRLYGDELQYRNKSLHKYEFSQWNIPVNPLSMMPGIGKLYAILNAIEDYPEKSYFVFADFDSIFMKKTLLLDPNNYYINTHNYEKHIATFSCVQSPYRYDTSFFYYYCMYKGMTYNDIEKYSNRYRYNSGLFVVDKTFITHELVDEYVKFCLNIHEDKMEYSKHIDKHISFSGMRLPYEESDSLSLENHSIFHPSDEVFFQYLRTLRNKEYDSTTMYPVLNETWNFIGDIKDNISDINHVHCIDKDNLELCLENSNV